MKLDPKALEAAYKAAWAHQLEHLSQDHTPVQTQTVVEAITAYLDAANMVPRELYDAALLTIGAKKNERDEARRSAKILEAALEETQLAVDFYKEKLETTDEDKQQPKTKSENPQEPGEVDEPD